MEQQDTKKQTQKGKPKDQAKTFIGAKRYQEVRTYIKQFEKSSKIK